MDDEDSILDGIVGGAAIGDLLFDSPVLGGVIGGLLDSFDE